MSKSKHLFCAAVACALAAAPLSAAELGDAAAPLKIEEWVKGDAVDLAKGKDKNIFVVEFWATWCGPCRMSIPHITEMQKKFKDKGVVFIGISDEPTAKVAPFVKEQGDKMNYVVACDTDRDTHKAYMEAFEQQGIPTAFVVDKSGRIAWVGHPMSGLEEVLEEVIAGKYDIEVAKRQMAARKKMVEYFELASKGEADSADKLKKLGANVVKDLNGDAQGLNQFSWVILTHPAIKTRDLELAMKAAQLAFDASGGKDWSILDTYARALFDTGKIAEAVKYQQKAIDLCDQPPAKKELEETLERYKKELPDEA